MYRCKSTFSIYQNLDLYLTVAWNLPNGPHKGHLSDSDVFGAWLMSLFGLAHFSFPNQSMLIFTTSDHLFEDLFPTGKEEISGFILQDWQGMIILL